MDKDGTAYSDFGCEDVIVAYVDRVNRGEDVMIHTSTENMIYALRVAVKLGKIDPSLVVLDLGSGDVYVDSNGKQSKRGTYRSFYEYALGILVFPLKPDTE